MITDVHIHVVTSARDRRVIDVVVYIDCMFGVKVVAALLMSLACSCMTAHM